MRNKPPWARVPQSFPGLPEGQQQGKQNLASENGETEDYDPEASLVPAGGVHLLHKPCPGLADPHVPPICCLPQEALYSISAAAV